MTRRQRALGRQRDRLLPGAVGHVSFGDFGLHRVVVRYGPDTEGRYTVELPAGAHVLVHRPSIQT